MVVRNQSAKMRLSLFAGLRPQVEPPPRSHQVTEPEMVEQSGNGFFVRVSRQNLGGCRIGLIFVTHASGSLRKRLIEGNWFR